MLPSSHPTVPKGREHEPTLVGVGRPAITPYKDKAGSSAPGKAGGAVEKTREDSMCEVSLSEVEVLRTSNDVERSVALPTSSWLRSDPAFALLMCSAALLAMFAVVASMGRPLKSASKDVSAPQALSSADTRPQPPKAVAAAEAQPATGATPRDTKLVDDAKATQDESSLKSQPSAQRTKKGARARLLAAKANTQTQAKATASAKATKTSRTSSVRDAKVKRPQKRDASASVALSVGAH